MWGVRDRTARNPVRVTQHPAKCCPKSPCPWSPLMSQSMQDEQSNSPTEVVSMASARRPRPCASCQPRGNHSNAARRQGRATNVRGQAQMQHTNQRKSNIADEDLCHERATTSCVATHMETTTTNDQRSHRTLPSPTDDGTSGADFAVAMRMRLANPGGLRMPAGVCESSAFPNETQLHARPTSAPLQRARAPAMQTYEQ